MAGACICKRELHHTHMKSREEYLVEFEAKLLGLLKDVYKSVNYNLTLAFSLSMLVVLIRWGGCN